MKFGSVVENSEIKFEFQVWLNRHVASSSQNNVITFNSLDFYEILLIKGKNFKTDVSDLQKTTIKRDKL